LINLLRACGPVTLTVWWLIPRLIPHANAKTSLSECFLKLLSNQLAWLTED